MRSSRGFIKRSFLILGVLGVLSVAAGSRPARTGPYQSALAPFGAAAAIAQTSCNNKGCVAGGHHNSNCGHLVGFNCQSLSGSSCANTYQCP